MKSYKPNPTNVKKNHAGGSFKNSGQKEGKKSLNAKEKASAHVTKRLRTISKGMFHTKEGQQQKAQENA